MLFALKRGRLLNTTGKIWKQMDGRINITDNLKHFRIDSTHPEVDIATLLLATDKICVKYQHMIYGLLKRFKKIKFWTAQYKIM